MPRMRPLNCCGESTVNLSVALSGACCNFFSATALLRWDVIKGITHDNRPYAWELRHRCGCAGGGTR
jgi:hypothetical protein